MRISDCSSAVFPSGLAAGQYLAQARRDLDGEYLHMLAIMLLLQARNATGFREEDRSRLNQARIRSGKPSLLDHRIAYMRIGEREARGPRRAECRGEGLQ